MTIRYLKPGEKLPTSKPTRYQMAHGYVALGWRDPDSAGSYVRAYEHRCVDGHVTLAEHVHHINGDRSDNRLENLEFITEAEHIDRHSSETQDRNQRIVNLWRTSQIVRPGGIPVKELGAFFGVDPSAVSRALARSGCSPAPSCCMPDPDPKWVEAARCVSRSAPHMARLLAVSTWTCRRLLEENRLEHFPAGRPKAEVGR